MAVRILVVEDDPLIQRLLGQMLSEDWTVRTASSVEEAIEQLDLFEFDAVVADLELGDRGRNGLWLLERVRERQPTAKRLLMSGHHEPLREASQSGNVIALPKPFTGADLLAAVAG
jgi:DNA-binding NtrC family response regulator